MRVNLFGSPLPVWYGWVFVLICLVAIFPFPQRGFLVLNLFSTLSVLNTHFLLLGKWPVLWGRLFPWALCLGISPYLDQIFPYRYLRSSGWDSRISLSASILRQCGPVVRALALRSGDPGFKTRSDHSLNLFLVVPGSTSQLHL